MYFINILMESEPSFEWTTLAGPEEQQIKIIAYDLIIAHIEAFHPGLAELFFLEEEKRIREGRENNSIMQTINGLITEMNLNRIVLDARSMLWLSKDEYMRRRAKYIEYLQGLSQSR